MGINDRDYHRTLEPVGRLGQVEMWSVTTWLLALNIAVFVAEAFWMGAHRPRLRVDPFERLGSFSIAAAIVHLQLYRVITCQFLHEGWLHLGANMIGLWLFGPIVESSLGRRRFLFFYLLCGIAGPLTYTALWGIGILTHLAPDAFVVPGMNTQLLGASAGIFGVMLAAAYLAPDRLISLYFFDVRLRYFAWAMMALAAYTVLVHGNGAGGQAAHLGGGLLGWILIRHEPLLNFAGRRKARGEKNQDRSRDLNR